jgi:hypothetical protein
MAALLQLYGELNYKKMRTIIPFFDLKRINFDNDVIHTSYDGGLGFELRNRDKHDIWRCTMLSTNSPQSVEWYGQVEYCNRKSDPCRHFCSIYDGTMTIWRNVHGTASHLWQC